MMRKINFVLCILIALVFIGQTFMMTRPYLQYIDKPTLFEREKEGKTDQTINYSLLQFVWTGWTDDSEMDEFLIEKLAEGGKIDPSKDEEEQLGEQSNDYVLGLVGITVLGAVVAIMTIFTRKSLVHYAFSILWALCSVYACFGDNYVLQNLHNAPGAGTVLTVMKILSIASVVLVAARAYPWFYSRFIYKEKLDLEALNA